MENIVMMITIDDRKKSEYYHMFFQEKNVKSSLGTFAKGTASAEMLEYLGIGDTEKCVVFSFMTMEKSKSILEEISSQITKRKNGDGIHITVPISSIDSLKSINKLVGDISEDEGEGYSMENEFELIVVISNRGYSADIMDVARKAGAKGGTVIHARGTGTENSEKFFGSLIGAEKEVIFIITKSEGATSIINAIKNTAKDIPAWESIVFSVPVIDIAGL